MTYAELQRAVAATQSALRQLGVGVGDCVVGYLPNIGDLNLVGCEVTAAALQELTAVPIDGWKREVASFREYLQEFGARMPSELLQELAGVEERLHV